MKRYISFYVQNRGFARKHVKTQANLRSVRRISKYLAFYVQIVHKKMLAEVADLEIFALY